MASETIDSVLFVEDDRDDADFFASVLTSTFDPAHLAGARSLAAARDQLAARAPDLVLLDLHLPDGLGYSLIEDIRRCNPAALVVVFTVFDDDDHLLSAIRAGADGYILKDEAPRDVAALLGEIRAGRPPLSARMARKVLSHLQTHNPRRDSALGTTERENEVLTLLARGHTIPSAALKLGLSTHTVKHHVRNIYRKLNVTNRASMMSEAMKKGLC